MARFRVELLPPDSPRAAYGTYPDDQWKFAFPQVAWGTYDLQVKLGEKALEQLEDHGTVERQRFRAQVQAPLRLPTVRVR